MAVGGNVHEQYQHECDLYWRELVTSWVYTHSLKSPNCVLQSYIQRVRDAMRSIPTGLQVTGFIEICGPEMRVDEPGTVDGPETCEPGHVEQKRELLDIPSLTLRHLSVVYRMKQKSMLCYFVTIRLRANLCSKSCFIYF